MSCLATWKRAALGAVCTVAGIAGLLLGGGGTARAEEPSRLAPADYYRATARADDLAQSGDFARAAVLYEQLVATSRTTPASGGNWAPAASAKSATGRRPRPSSGRSGSRGSPTRTTATPPHAPMPSPATARAPSTRSMLSTVRSLRASSGGRTSRAIRPSPRSTTTRASRRPRARLPGDRSTAPRPGNPTSTSSSPSSGASTPPTGCSRSRRVSNRLRRRCASALRA
jgi:hypothetical protein